MPFKVYCLEEMGEDVTKYIFEHITHSIPRSLVLHVREEIAKGETVPLKWHMDEGNILAKMGLSVPGHALIVDLKPKVMGNVSLYRIRDIWGVSSKWWTPIAVRLEVLFADRAEQDAETFKSCFDVRKAKRDLVHEFLYLRGGPKDKWRWGMVGSINGALLWPEAWNYFTSQIGLQ